MLRTAKFVWPKDKKAVDTVRDFVTAGLQAGDDALREQGFRNEQIKADAQKALSEARRTSVLAETEEERRPLDLAKEEAAVAKTWAEVRATEASAAEAAARAELLVAQAGRETIAALRELKEQGFDVTPIVENGRISMYIRGPLSAKGLPRKGRRNPSAT